MSIVMLFIVCIVCPVFASAREGYVYMEAGLAQEATFAFVDALSDPEDEPAAWLGLAELARFHDPVAEEWIRRAAGDAGGQLAAGWEAHYEGDLRTARELLQACVEQEPSWVPARLLLAWTLLRLDDGRGAQEHVEKVLIEQPANRDALALRRLLATHWRVGALLWLLFESYELKPVPATELAPGEADAAALLEAYGTQMACRFIGLDCSSSFWGAEDLRRFRGVPNGIDDAFVQAQEDALQAHHALYLARDTARAASLAQSAKLRFDAYEGPGVGKATLLSARMSTILGEAAYLEGRVDAAASHFEEAMRLYEADRVQQARVSLRLAALEVDLGRVGVARERISRARERFPGSEAGWTVVTVDGRRQAVSVPDPRWELAVIALLEARLESRAGRYHVAEEKLQAALTGFSDNGLGVWEADAHLEMAEMLSRAGDMERAEAHLDAAMERYRWRSTAGMAAFHTARGEHRLRQARYVDAQAELEAAQAIQLSLGDQRGVAHSLLGLAQASLAWGQYQQTEDRCLDAMGRYVRAGHILGTARVRHQLLQLRVRQGRRDEARLAYFEARQGYMEAGSEVGLAWLELSRGQGEERFGSLDGAQRVYEGALAQFVQIGEPLGIAEAQLATGRVQLERGVEAAPTLCEARAQFVSAKHSSGVVRTNAALLRALRSGEGGACLGEPQLSGEQLYREGLTAAGDAPIVEPLLELHLAWAHLASDEELRRTTGELAGLPATLDQVLLGRADEIWRAGQEIRRSRAALHRVALALHHERRDSDAFALLSALQGRRLWAHHHLRTVRHEEPLRTGDDWARVLALQPELDALHRALWDDPEGTTVDFSAFERDLHLRRVMRGDSRTPLPSLTEVQGRLRELDSAHGPATMLSFHTDGASILVQVISPRGYTLIPITQASDGLTVQEAVDRRVNSMLLSVSSFYQGISRHSSQANALLAEQLSGLYSTLIGPLRWLPGEGPLIISADGALEQVPFAALLRDEGPFDSADFRGWGEMEFLMTRERPVMMLPSPGWLVVARGPSGRSSSPEGSQALLVGMTEFGRSQDRLTGTAASIRSIAKQLESEGWSSVRLVCDDPRDSRCEVPSVERFLSLASEADMVHIATHGQSKPSVLTEHGGGSLSMFALHEPVWEHRVLNLDLDAELVVLAACHSGAQGERALEGSMGLAHAFFVAGAQSVISARWEVDDHFSPAFFIYFHEALRAKQGEGTLNSMWRLDAFHEAQMRMKEDGDGAQFPSPIDWAAFTWIGRP